MISFTVKGKNFPSGATHWGPNVYHIVNGEWEYIAPVGWESPDIWPAVSQTVHFSETPAEVGFMVFFRDATGKDITGPYGGASTSLFPIKDKGGYILDFHGEVGIPTLLEEEAPPEDLPTWAKGVGMLIPWSPLFGPPLPKGFFPPWPMWMSRWTEIPGYPKVPDLG